MCPGDDLRIMGEDSHCLGVQETELLGTNKGMLRPLSSSFHISHGKSPRKFIKLRTPRIKHGENGVGEGAIVPAR